MSKTRGVLFKVLVCGEKEFKQHDGVPYGNRTSCSLPMVKVENGIYQLRTFPSGVAEKYI